jgi:hypothetical protein
LAEGEVVSSLGLILMLIPFWMIYLGFTEDQTSKKVSKLNQQRKAAIRGEEFINKPDRLFLRWIMDEKGSYKRAIKRKQHLKNEGIQEPKYLGGGYIYIVPAQVRDFKKKLRWVGYDINDSQDWKHMHPAFVKLSSACRNFPFYRPSYEHPYKIGYTSRDVALRLQELNETSDLNYCDWEFENEASYVWVDTNIEKIESRIHWALRDIGKELMGEIFHASWDDIASIVKEKTGKEITKSASRDRVELAYREDPDANLVLFSSV